jgi:eukaryotic-like serine/threonine-protein kinase
VAPADIAHYRITSKIGEGGMGAVYRATDTKLGRDVAVKVILDVFVQDAERLARFTREAHVLASLNHPNIASIYAVEPGAIVMELVAGRTVAELVAGAASSGAQMPQADALAIARQLAEALEYAHERGVVHRDLKPANMKVTPEGQLKLLDFGLAKALVQDATGAPNDNSPTFTAQATHVGVILGTAAYMSPEQAAGRAVDRRADIWAFGAVLYEMLTGSRSFDGDSVVETLAGVMKQEPDWTRIPAETPAAIRRLVKRCLEKDPRRRLRDIGEARIVLEDAGSNATDATAPVSTAAGPRGGATIAWILAGTLGAALLVATAALQVSQDPPDGPTLRSTIVAPDSTTFNFSDDPQLGPMAISPDGRLLAFSVRDEKAGIRLWVRSLDSLSARPLPGGEGGSYPFWSPDSQQIGFFAGGKLKKIPAAGGNSTPLADAANGRGGTWNRHDVILYAPGYFTTVHRVSALGGPATPVTSLDAARSETSNRFPWFLPDGRHFLYTAQDTNAIGDRVTIRLASLDSTGSQVVTDSRSNVVYSLGYLLYLRVDSYTLVAQPFDVQTLVTTGEPIPLVEGVRTVSFTACGVFSASTNGLLVHQSGAAEDKVRLSWVDRSGATIRAAGDPIRAPLGSLHFSPDGKRLAISIPSATTSQGSDIWIQDMARDVRTPLTSSPRVKRAAVWSPDGRTIVFDARRDSPGGRQNLYRQRLDGTEPEELLHSDDVNNSPTSWSPDGRFLLYTRGGSGAPLDIFVLPEPLGPAGARKPMGFLVSRFGEASGQFSPDGRSVAYHSNEAERNEIWVAPFPGPGKRVRISTEGGSSPRWRADGKEIFFIAPNGRLMAAELTGTGDALEVVRVVPLFPGVWLGGATYTYDVARDGKSFLVAGDRGTRTAADPLTLVQNWATGLGRK